MAGLSDGVVVHLQLAVNFEATGALERLPPELVKAGGQVGALLFKDCEAFAVAFGVAGRRIGALGFFAGVVDLEREDGEPVNDHARRLGVERGSGVGQALGFERGKQRAVKFLGQVVAELVGAVDAALYFGQFRVGCAGSAGFVFNVPEVEVGAVLAGDQVEPVGCGLRD